MSLQPMSVPPVPADTARLAKAVFKKGNLYMTIGDQIGYLFADIDFSEMYAADGSPAISPARLALVTIFQFMEHVTDREAAELVRARIDWKYALGLELSDAGFHYSVLCEFRSRLMSGQAENLLFEALLKLFKERGWLKARTRQRSDSTHIVAAVRKLNRVELVSETLYHALDVLAQLAPEWLRTCVQPDWFERYSQRPTGFRLAKSEA